MQTEIRAQVWAKTNGHCWYCGTLMNPWEDFTIDHMDPQKHGGGDEVENLIPACKECNSRKNAKTVEQYRGYLVEKKAVRFWGEYIAISQTVAMATEEREDESYPHKYEDIVGLCMSACPYQEPQLAVVLLALMQLAVEWGEGPAYCAGRVSFDDLAALTHMPKEAVLACLFRIYKAAIIELPWNDRTLQHQYVLDFTSLGSINPWEW